jgi:mono/diheme cytochrome c family protein
MNFSRISLTLALFLAAFGVAWLDAGSSARGAEAAEEDRRSLVDRGKKLFMAHGCYGCHMVGTAGTPIGPDLSRIGFKYPESYLVRWLRDPSAQKPTAHMPKITLTEAEIRALAAYLASLQ